MKTATIQRLACTTGIMTLALICATPPLRAEVLSSPESIRRCLCAEQGVAALSAQVQAGYAAYEEGRKRADMLNDIVQTKRPQVNVNNAAEVDAFRHLLEQRDEASAQFADKTSPDYAAQVERYNAKVAEFNSSCANKSYDSVVLAQVKAGLSCP